MKLNGRFNADLCVRKIYGEPSLYVSIHISFFYFACITTLCFTEALEMYDFPGAEELDGVRDFRNIADYAEDVVIGGACFLFCSQVFKQIGDGISFALEFAGIKGDSSGSLGPDANSVIDIVGAKTGFFDFLHGKVSG